MRKQTNPIFTVHASTSGNLMSDFVFVDRNAYRRWRNREFKALCLEYPGLTVRTETLKPVHVGDRCRVIGDGARVYKILSLEQYEPHRFGFVLSSGCCEGVHKCVPVS
jgi:hypothetical protein